MPGIYSPFFKCQGGLFYGGKEEQASLCQDTINVKMPGGAYKLHFVKMLKMAAVVLTYSRENNHYFLNPLNDYSLTADLVNMPNCFQTSEHCISPFF